MPRIARFKDTIHHLTAQHKIAPFPKPCYQETKRAPIKLEMWANTQRHGRPVEYRWRSSSNRFIGRPVRPMISGPLSVRCLSYNLGTLWPNGWMTKHATW